MKKLLFLIPVMCIGLIITGLRTNGKTYRCLPCGRSCDATVVNSPGTCSACGMRLVDSESIRFKTLSFKDLCGRLKNGKDILLLDVRSPGEFNNASEGESFGKFKNAVNINITDLESRVGEIDKFKNKEVIVYCSHSHRSPEASYFLSTHGFTNVSNVSGGVSVLKNDPAAACLKDRFIEFLPKK
jgi:rhodanese-related sulfurtransferase